MEAVAALHIMDPIKITLRDDEKRPMISLHVSSSKHLSKSDTAASRQGGARSAVPHPCSIGPIRTIKAGQSLPIRYPSKHFDPHIWLGGSRRPWLTRAIKFNGPGNRATLDTPSFPQPSAIHISSEHDSPRFRLHDGSACAVFWVRRGLISCDASYVPPNV